MTRPSAPVAAGATTKSELVIQLAIERGLPQAVAKKAVDRLLGEITLALANGRRVEPRAFGAFHLTSPA